MLRLLYYFIKISNVVGLVFCLLGFGIGFIKGHTNAMKFKQYYVNYSNCYNYSNFSNFLIEYINEISYCMIIFSLIFYFIGFIIPIIILIFVLWKIFSIINFLNKQINKQINK